MTPLLAQTIVILLILITGILLLLMGYLLWLQLQDVAEQDRRRNAQRERLAGLLTGQRPQPFNSARTAFPNWSNTQR